jgi:hypothetical protein
MAGRVTIKPPLDCVVYGVRPGVEPGPARSQRAVLPLHHPHHLVRPEGFEPSTAEVEARCSDPLSYGRLARQVGFEPTTSGSEARRTDPLCYWRMKRRGTLSELQGLADLTGNFSPATSPIRSPTPMSASVRGVSGLGGWDRTSDILLPRQARYRCATPREIRSWFVGFHGQDSTLAKYKSTTVRWPSGLGTCLSSKTTQVQFLSASP